MENKIKILECRVGPDRLAGTVVKESFYSSEINNLSILLDFLQSLPEYATLFELTLKELAIIARNGEHLSLKRTVNNEFTHLTVTIRIRSVEIATQIVMAEQEPEILDAVDVLFCDKDSSATCGSATVEQLYKDGK